MREPTYIGHEVYFPNDDVPQTTIDLLKRYGFCKSSDGFYIAREELGTFRSLASPYRVELLQPNITLGGEDPEELMNQLLDMVNALKEAGVQGVDNFIAKIKDCPESN